MTSFTPMVGGCSICSAMDHPTHYCPHAKVPPQPVTLCDVCGQDHDGQTHMDFVDSYCEEG